MKKTRWNAKHARHRHSNAIREKECVSAFRVIQIQHDFAAKKRPECVLKYGSSECTVSTCRYKRRGGGRGWNGDNAAAWNFALKLAAERVGGAPLSPGEVTSAALCALQFTFQLDRARAHVNVYWDNIHLALVEHRSNTHSTCRTDIILKKNHLHFFPSPIEKIKELYSGNTQFTHSILLSFLLLLLRSIAVALLARDFLNR